MSRQSLFISMSLLSGIGPWGCPKKKRTVLDVRNAKGPVHYRQDVQSRTRKGIDLMNRMQTS